jgi:predicted transcriptional regulator
MSDTNYVTKKELDTALDKRFKQQMDEIGGLFQTFMNQVDARFNSVEARQDEQDRKFDRLMNTLDAFLKRLDDYEIENVARDRQFERLLAWARKVSEKTGIPLENL